MHYEAVQSSMLLTLKARSLFHCCSTDIFSGGPHSAYTTAYFYSLSFLCAHGGYAILIPNYRGSTGFGQASIDALPTNIGTMDVQDVVGCTRQLLQSRLVDSDRVGIAGGSHGVS